MKFLVTFFFSILAITSAIPQVCPSNLSTSGVDGKYQAIARGRNLVGIFRFRYVDGDQIRAERDNDRYLFFIDGQIYGGSVQTVVNGSEVVGILDRSSNGMAGGFFSGMIDQGYPFAFFHGTGEVSFITATPIVPITKEFKFNGSALKSAPAIHGGLGL